MVIRETIIRNWMEKQISLLKEKLTILLDSEERSFDKMGDLDSGGVYAVFHGKEIIYVGETDNFKGRMNKLLGDPSHVLHGKLMEYLDTGDLEDKRLKQKVKNFLKKECRFKTIKLNKKERIRLEGFAKSVLDPKYNER